MNQCCLPQQQARVSGEVCVGAFCEGCSNKTVFGENKIQVFFKGFFFTLCLFGGLITCSIADVVMGNAKAYSYTCTVVQHSMYMYSYNIIH